MGQSRSVPWLTPNIHGKFIETINSLLQLVPKNSKIIIGADINAKVGK